MKTHIRSALSQSQSMLQQFIDDETNIERIDAAATLLCETFSLRSRVFSCGNGGSMSDAMHFAEELSGRYRNNRPALAATAISDPGHLSCVANDFGYAHVFSRYLEACARPGDCLLAISTSGTSKNIIEAANYARANQISVIALTGAPGSALGELANIELSAGPSRFADRIQEIHIKIIHILIEVVERQLFQEQYSE